MKKIAIALILLLASMICFQCYYIRQGVTLFDLYTAARDIDRVLESGTLDPEEKRLLLMVKEIKAFAVTRLGLSANSNYSSYVSFDRDYLAAVVSACDGLSFRQYYWNYIFVGDLPYKGFFNPDEARQEAQSLKNEGYDVFVRPVDAFSTLGILSDPIFSFMKDYPAYVLADLIIHEQAHATVFLTGQTTFNENLASFVGEEGMKLFVLEKYGEASDEYRTALALEADRQAVALSLVSLRISLEKIYSSNATPDEKNEAKKKTIAAWKDEFRREYDKRFRSDLYRAFPDRDINNAVIMTYMNYTEKSSEMRDIFALCGGDVVLFIRLARSLKPDESVPMAALRRLAAERGGPSR